MMLSFTGEYKAKFLFTLSMNVLIWLFYSGL